MPESDEKICPFCAETIKAAAIVCKHCNRELETANSVTVLDGNDISYGAITGRPTEIVAVPTYIEPEPIMEHNGLTCPKCGFTGIHIQAVTRVESKGRGCIDWMFIIVLSLFTFGLALIVFLLTSGKTTSKTCSEAVCQKCGHRWPVEKESVIGGCIALAVFGLIVMAIVRGC